jgi:hypothetical protein
MRATRLTQYGWLVALLALGGCAAREQEDWSSTAQVRWSDVGGASHAPVSDGFVLLSETPTTGRFPATLAVTRVAVREAEDSPKRERYLTSKPHNEFLEWNSALDNQMAIASVFPIWQRDLGGGPVELGQVLAAFRALGGTVGLIYAGNRTSATEAEMFGILYDTESTRPLAAIHASAASLPEEEEDGTEARPHIWQRDARALVRAEFSGLVHACMRELIVRDVPERVDVPPGWKPEHRYPPVEWPPR